MKKSKFERMEEMAAGFDSGSSWEREYHGYFVCFNRREYYEAHDVLEHLWLQRRGSEDDLFFKALIQLAGCFVHLKKGKVSPAGRLFRIARGYFSDYSPRFRGLEMGELDELIALWLERIEESGASFRLEEHLPPKLDPAPPAH